VGSRAKRDAPQRLGMPLSFTHLGTGSRGNATLVESNDVKILIDQGFSGRQLETRLARMEIRPQEIDAIVLTHHHSDHGGGASIAQRRWDIPIYCNDRTATALNLDLKNVQLFESLEALDFANDFALLPVPVPHSGADNVAFIASHKGERGAVITDLGSWTDELINHVSGCQHISIESNYDNKRLWNGPYPMKLKDRIAGRGGHLSNDQTGQFLSQVVDGNTRSIVLTHLSEKNNAPHLAESTVLYHLDDLFEGDIQISLQDGPEFTHHIGQSESEKVSREGLTLRG